MDYFLFSVTLGSAACVMGYDAENGCIGVQHQHVKFF